MNKNTIILMSVMIAAVGFVLLLRGGRTAGLILLVLGAILLIATLSKKRP